MTRTGWRIGILMAMVSSVGLASCGAPRELTREKALELLRAQPDLLNGREAIWDNALMDLVIGDGDDKNCRTKGRILMGEELEKARVITRTVTKFPRYDEYRSGGTSYKHTIVDPTFVRQGLSGVLLVMATPEITEVTGIAQEGEQAMAEVTVEYRPTPLVASQERAEARLPEVGFSGCERLFELPNPETMSFRFQRFDDGWRLATGS